MSYLEQASSYSLTVGPGVADPFIGRCAEFPDLIGAGDTAAEAVEQLVECIAAVLEILADDGEAAPLPLAGASGVLHLRVPRSLHRELQQRADLEGVSLNQTAALLLTRALQASSTVPAPRQPGRPRRAS
ncbi:MAG: toxin-antitoxin system HicB family antitoxin [Fimbriimonadaceae bacterium]|nr:toxin-antitoxin system HicB family antitoxin [Fimbriimonadaceae bacterium]